MNLYQISNKANQIKNIILFISLIFIINGSYGFLGLSRDERICSAIEKSKAQKRSFNIKIKNFNGNEEIIKILPTNSNPIDSLGNPLLLLAIKYNWHRTAEKLIKQHKDFNIDLDEIRQKEETNDFGDSIESNSINATLINKNKNYLAEALNCGINLIKRHDNPIEIFQRLYIAYLLIKNGAKKNHNNTSIWNPEKIENYLNANLDYEQSFNEPPPQYTYILFWAILFEDKKSAEILVANGANIRYKEFIIKDFNFKRCKTYQAILLAEILHGQDSEIYKYLQQM